jgi:hypothetical protein
VAATWRAGPDLLAGRSMTYRPAGHGRLGSMTAAAIRGLPGERLIIRRDAKLSAAAGWPRAPAASLPMPLLKKAAHGLP